MSKQHSSISSLYSAQEPRTSPERVTTVIATEHHLEAAQERTRPMTSNPPDGLRSVLDSEGALFAVRAYATRNLIRRSKANKLVAFKIFQAVGG